MRIGLVAVIFALVFSAVSGYAQDAENEALCKNGPSAKVAKEDLTAYLKHLDACDALIEGGFTDLPWVYERRGNIYAGQLLRNRSLEEFSRSLAIDPDYVPALKARALENAKLGNYEDALPDAERLIGLEPDYYWHHYIHGAALAGIDRNQEAIAALDRSIALRDTYYSAWRKRAGVHLDAGHTDLAIADYNQALELRPFDTFAYVALGQIYQDLEQRDATLRNYRIALALDPNLQRIAYRLNNMRQEAVESDLAPLAYVAPQDGLSLRYLQVILPRETREEMEVAIMDLMNWFTPVAKASPKAAAFISRTLHPDGDIVSVDLTLGAQDRMEKFLPPGGKMPQGVQALRGVLLTEIRPIGDKGPAIRIIYDGQQPADIWPLEVGNSINGTGRYQLICPDKFQMASMMMGCRIGMDSLDLGVLEYSLVVDRIEQVEVPMGDFVTYVLRYRELATVKFGPSESERQIESNWWIDPALNFWVKQTSQVGENISTRLAVALN